MYVKKDKILKGKHVLFKERSGNPMDISFCPLSCQCPTAYHDGHVARVMGGI